MNTAAIRHVLLDADGVLQGHAAGWVPATARWLGDRAEEFLGRAFVLEEDDLVGGDDFMLPLADLLVDYGVDVDVDEFHAAVWHDIAVDPWTLDLVARIRASGLGVHLGSNQRPRRAEHMRHELGYDELFDHSFYSCELGVAKPAPAFFRAVVDRLGVTPGQVLFVDDLEVNVAGAHEAGLVSVHWHLDHGRERLSGLLAEHGVLTGS